MSKFISCVAVLALVVGCGEYAADSPSATGDVSSSSSAELAGTDSESEVTEVAFNVADDPTVAIEVPGMHCEACAASIEKTLVAEPGVKDIKLNVEKKTATVAIDESAFDTSKAIESLASAGWDEAEEVAEGSEEPVESEG